ncbi:MAG: ATP-binding cassette domain-containing protein [Candidatus Aegiribacteria sp.]|nr:ATP-binding cassette domain-containing protein [Candidatus Aegiribacteria sp.]
MKKKSTLFRILSYLGPYWKWMTGAMLCMVLFAILSGASLGMILPLFDNVFARNDTAEEKSDFLPTLSQNTGDAFSRLGSELLSLHPGGVFSAGGDVVEGVRDSLRESDPQQVLIVIVLGLVFIVLLKNFLGFMQIFFLSRAEQGVVTDIRGGLYNHLLELDMGFYTSTRSGDVMARFTSDVGNMNWAMTEMMMSVPRQAVLLLVYLGLALWASWRLALITLLVFPPAMLFILILSRRLRRKTHYSQERLSDFSALLQETIFGIRIVKAFSMEKFEVSRFKTILDVHRKTETSLQRERAFASPVTEIMGSIASGFIMWYGGSAILSGGSLSTGRFLVFLAAALSMMKPIKTISNANSRIQTGIASAERVFNLMDRVPAIRQPLNPVSFDSFHERIEFRNVCFSYENGTPVLTDVSFSFEKGEIIALVGPSGGGKSTIADLIPRFYDPDSGSILIDGSDLRTIDLEALRKNLGVVTQETVLFNDTVRNNIAYGEESIPIEKVRLAAEVANALEFIEKLPRGFSTIIGERGAKLSGGQRQRLAIARAVLKDPDILIFDEATSALDTHSERQVQKAIDGLIKGRTSLIIAHRLSTITKATRVLYIDKGRIVESGTHPELLEMNGKYRLLYDMQFAGK